MLQTARQRDPVPSRRNSKSSTERCIRKFLRYFKRGFDDPKYFDWERGYKLAAHEQFEQELGRRKFGRAIKAGEYLQIAQIATRIESKTNLLFSFEKMAFRDAVRSEYGAKIFAEGLYDLLYGRGGERARFERWCDAVSALPRKQTRVLTHPVVTVFPFLADPQHHIFLKPTVTRRAAAAYGYEFAYSSKPSWPVYSSLVDFALTLKKDLKQLEPKDMIDIQSFIWVQGSDEYP